MTRPRASSYADRLPPLVPREEADISHLSDEMADVLYPGRRRRPFRIEIMFDSFEGPGYIAALEVARQAPVHSVAGEGQTSRHRAAFEVSGARLLRELFAIVGERPGTEVLIDGKPLPYARELWLPLFWLFVAENA